VEPEVAAGAPKKRTFRKYSYRGVDLDALLDMSTDDLVQLFPARARRRYISCCDLLVSEGFWFAEIM
jgi:small subunit ribosomal protein S15e